MICPLVEGIAWDGGYLKGHRMASCVWGKLNRAWCDDLINLKDPETPLSCRTDLYWPSHIWWFSPFFPDVEKLTAIRFLSDCKNGEPWLWFYNKVFLYNPTNRIGWISSVLKHMFLLLILKKEKCNKLIMCATVQRPIPFLFVYINYHNVLLWSPLTLKIMMLCGCNQEVFPRKYEQI